MNIADTQTRCLLGMLVALWGIGWQESSAQRPAPLAYVVPEKDSLRQRNESAIGPQTLSTASDLIRASEAVADFGVDGSGLAVAIIDSGLRKSHKDFSGRVPVVRNFSNVGAPDDVTDNHGHGTFMAGIVAGKGVAARGIARRANVVPLKVYDDANHVDLACIVNALKWVIAEHKNKKISVVNLSIGDKGNYPDDAITRFCAVQDEQRIRQRILELRELNIPVVVSAGNHWWIWNDSAEPGNVQQGMSHPAILHTTISVGAVFDRNIGKVNFVDSSVARSSGTRRIVPFSQRISSAANTVCKTDIFAPGTDIISTGRDSDVGPSSNNGHGDHGTSQAAPFVTGVILLMQDYYLKHGPGHQLPSVDVVERCLYSGGTRIFDGDDEDDNVKHCPSDQEFRCLNAVGALNELKTVMNESS